MYLSKIVRVFYRVIGLVSRIANSVGVVFLAVMMFLTTADVCLRYFFNRPLLGAFELTEFMMAILVSLGIGYTALEKGHVSVELVVNLLPRKTRAILNSIINLISLCFFSLLTWQSVLQAQTQAASGQTSSLLYIPVFPFIWVLAIGSGLLSLILLLNFFEYLAEAVE